MVYLMCGGVTWICQFRVKFIMMRLSGPFPVTSLIHRDFSGLRMDVWRVRGVTCCNE